MTNPSPSDGVGCKCGWPLDSCNPQFADGSPCDRERHERAAAPRGVVLVLVGGPFDGDRMKFRPEQTAIVVPESAAGRMHRYSVAADGRAHYECEVAE